MKKMPDSVMVFDHNMNPAWCDSPEKAASWLRFQQVHRRNKLRGYTVRTAWPHEFLTVSEYLDRHPVDDTEGTKQ